MGTPADTWTFVQGKLSQPPCDWRYFGLVALSWCLYLLLGLVTAVHQENVWLTVYVLVTVVFVGLMQGFFNAKARFLLPAFPAFLPVARLLSSCPRWVQVIFVFAVTGLSTWWSLDVLSGNISP